MKLTSDIEYKPGLVGDLFLPGGDIPTGGFPAAVLIHGGGWSGMDRHAVRGIADFLVETGFAVFNIEYRLTTQARWPAGFEDCKAAVRYLAAAASDHPVNPARIFVVGGSAGGHYALLAGLDLPRGTVCGIVSISGIDDVFVDCRFAPRQGRFIPLLCSRPAASAACGARYASPVRRTIFAAARRASGPAVGISNGNV